MLAPEVTTPQASRFLPFYTPTARSTSHSTGQDPASGSSICLDQHREMRTSAVAFAALLLLLILAKRAHGIRLDRQTHEALSSKETGDPKSGAAGEASISASVTTTKHCALDNGRCSGKVKRALAHAETIGAKKQQQQQESSNSSTTANDHHSSEVDAQQGRHEAEATSSHASLDASAAAAAAAEASPGVARQRERQTYPDIMDIAGMDYSPATRKPPIHN